MRRARGQSRSTYRKRGSPHTQNPRPRNPFFFLMPRHGRVSLAGRRWSRRRRRPTRRGKGAQAANLNPTLAATS